MSSPSDIDPRLLSLVEAAIPEAIRGVPIAPDSSLNADLGLDSLALVTLLFRLEQEFGIDLLSIGGDMAELRTVRHLSILTARANAH